MYGGLSFGLKCRPSWRFTSCVWKDCMLLGRMFYRCQLGRVGDGVILVVCICWFLVSSFLSYWRWNIRVFNCDWWAVRLPLQFCWVSELLQAGSFLIVVSLWGMDLNVIMSVSLPLLCLLTSLCLRLTRLSWLWCGSCLHVFFCLFTFIIVVYLNLKSKIIGQHIFGSCSFNPVWHFCLLIEPFSLLTWKAVFGLTWLPFSELFSARLVFFLLCLSLHVR